MRNTGFSAGLLAFGFVALQAAPPPDGVTLKTPAEESGYARYSQNEDIARFLSVLDFSPTELTALPYRCGLTCWKKMERPLQYVKNSTWLPSTAAHLSWGC